MSDGKRLKIGVMGCANIAVRSVIPAIKHLDRQFELVAVASRTADKASRIAEMFDCRPVVGYDALLALELDAVYVPLPTGLHEAWISKVLEKKLHVLSEKSFATRLDSAKRMLDIARKNKLVVYENFMFEYHRQHAIVNKLIDQGRIGEIRCIVIRFGFPPFPDGDNIRYNKELGGGALLDAGAYTIKAAQLILGGNLLFVNGHMTVDRIKDVDLWGSATLISANGTTAQLSWGFDNHYQCGYDIWGSRGRIITNRAFTAREDFRPSVIVEDANGIEHITVEEDNHFENLLVSFSESILNGDSEQAISSVLAQSELISAVHENCTKTHI